MEEDKKIPKKWCNQQEVILKAWGEAAACYRWMHYQAFLKYRKSNMHYTLPVIILSTITGTANFAQEQFPESLKAYVPPTIGGLNLIAGLIATISQFLKISELMESHRLAAMTFGKFSRMVRLQLSMPLEDRDKDGADLVEICKSEYDTLIEQSPSIPADILKKFETDFPGDAEDNITRPEILHIEPIRKFLSNLPTGDTSGQELMENLAALGNGKVPAKEFFENMVDEVLSHQSETDGEEEEELEEVAVEENNNNGE